MQKWQQIKARLTAGLARFMQGRYGADEFGLFLIWTSLILVIVGGSILYGVPALLGTAGWIYSLFRVLSRNKSRRLAENRKYLEFTAKVRKPIQPHFNRFRQYVNRLRSRNKFVYFTCPKCGMKLRLPRGVGNVTVTCKSCGSKFEKKA